MDLSSHRWEPYCVKMGHTEASIHICSGQASNTSLGEHLLSPETHPYLFVDMGTLLTGISGYWFRQKTDLIPGN